MKYASLAAATALVLLVSACSSRDSQPTTSTSTSQAIVATATALPHASPSPPAVSPIAVTGADKEIKVRWRWDSGLFNVVMWVRASGAKVAASYGGLYEGPGNFSSRPGGVALLDAATGTELWRRDTPTQAFPAAFANGVVAAGTGDGTVFAWDQATGAERWRLSFDGIPFQVVQSASLFVVADADPETWGPNGLVDKTRLGGRVWGVDSATGTVLWKTSVGSFNAFIAVESLLTGGFIAASSSSPTGDGNTVAIEPLTGNVRWSKPVEASSPPAVEGSLLVVPGASMEAFDLTSGAPRWSAPAPGGGTYFFPGITGNTVVSGTNTGSLNVLDARDGHLLASAQMGECASGQWFQGFGLAYALFCGSLVRMDHATAGWTLVRILTAQGPIDSAAGAGTGIVLSTGIGSAPEQVLFIEP
ncbi:MAG: PQQ-binding-like beta-propeller repeat protein [bacterium]